MAIFFSLYNPIERNRSLYFEVKPMWLATIRTTTELVIIICNIIFLPFKFIARLRASVVLYCYPFVLLSMQRYRLFGNRQTFPARIIVKPTII